MSWKVRKGEKEIEYEYLDAALWAAMELIGKEDGMKFDHENKVITIGHCKEDTTE